MGGSFGGYMANWVAGHTDRFAAIVSHASLWNFDAMATSDEGYYFAREFGDPADQPAVWLPTPYLELLDELGAPLAVDEAWVWPASSAWLQAPGKTFREARAALTGQDSEPAGIALTLVKQLYTSRIGAFSPHDPDPARIDELVRPDVTDMIIGKATCNDYRRMAKIGEQSGRWPVALYADSVYYAAEDPDPVAAAPAGLALGTGLGQYSAEAVIPMGVVRGKLGEPGLQAEIERFLRGPN